MRNIIAALAICALSAAAVLAEEAGKTPAQPAKAPVKKESPKAKEAPAKKAAPGKEAPKAKGTQKAKAPVSTETAKTALPGAPAAKEQPAAVLTPEARVLGELMKWDEKLLSLHARFTQEFDFAEAGLKQRIEGTLDYKKPDLLKIEHIKPARQLVYTDKKDLWVYKPEDSQAVKTSWAAWKRTQTDNLSGILDFGNYASLTERNAVTVSTAADSPYITVTFTSRNDPQAYKLSLALSATDYFPAEASLSVDKTVITTKFESMEKNVPIDDAVFKFIQPKGTEVLEFNN